MTAINTNINAIAAQNSLRVSGLNQSTAMERLSTGIRINSAKDDAAGLAISTRMTANIRGISAAIRNANDGISLTQTAEGSLTSIGDNLQRIRELAVQSANSGNNPSDRAALNSEASQLIAEIDRIANNSTFNGIKLLDGSYKDQSLQVGAGNEQNDRISISIGDARTERLGAATTAQAVGVPITKGDQIENGQVTINGTNVGATFSDGVSIYQSEGSAISKANAINAISNKTGVIASTRATTYTFAATDGEGDFKFALNGVLIQGTLQPEVEGTPSVASASNIAAAVNAVSDKTGVYADIGSDGTYSLTANDGRNIVISINQDEIDKLETDIARDEDGVPTDADYISVGLDGTGIEEATDIRDFSWATGEDAGGSGATAVAADSYIIYGSVDLATDSLKGIALGGPSASINNLGISSTVIAASKSAGSGVGSVNLSNARSSQSALATLDRAIDAVTNMRASMGAYQNRLTASIANLENTAMNLTASRSRILDTDYAKETTNLAKSQIIQQAATAMLAQANQSAQSVLALLK
jgi:flagellin